MDLTSLSAINGLESVSRYDKLQTIQEAQSRVERRARPVLTVCSVLP
ncbi:MAG: hypothetical protein ACLSCU_02090 [Eubacterium sp.]